MRKHKDEGRKQDFLQAEAAWVDTFERRLFDPAHPECTRNARQNNTSITGTSNAPTASTLTP